MVTQRLHLTEAALATATQAAEERAQTLEELTKRAGSNQGGARPNLHQLEGRVQSLIISEAGALSRAEAAEKVLEDAMNGCALGCNTAQLLYSWHALPKRA